MRDELANAPRHPDAPARANEALLLRAARAVRCKVWVRKTLPLNLVFILPGLMFVGTRSKIVLAIFAATYPLMLVLRAILGQLLSSRIGSEETLLRMEYQKLLTQFESAAINSPDQDR